MCVCVCVCVCVYVFMYECVYNDIQNPSVYCKIIFFLLFLLKVKDSKLRSFL